MLCDIIAINPSTGGRTISRLFDHKPFDDQGAQAYQEDRPRRRLFKRRTRKPSFVLAVVINTFQMLMLVVLLAGLAGIGAVVGIAKAYVETAPVLDIAKISDQDQTSFFYDRDGKLITDYKGTENRIMVSINTMPHYLRNAFVAAEDVRFYGHSGVDVKRIIGAFVTNFVSGSQQGGSTITQQLIKNTLLSAEQSYKRKIQEAYLALQLETRYTKDEILESYLNTIYLGENYYGVKVAAEGYFGKELHELTLRECAMLAGMTTNPYYYNCRRNFYTRQAEGTDYAAITNNRTNYVLRVMYEHQMITHAEFTEAQGVDTATVLENDPQVNTLYPYVHYVEYAVRDVVQTLLKLEGLENSSANRARMETKLRTGGYKVYLALDTQMQKTLEDTLYNYKEYPALRDPGTETYRAKNPDGTFTDIIQPQAGAAIIDYRTGEIKAIVGSRTPPDARKTLNRAVDMNMPVGSSIKPLTVYAPAFDMGAGGGSVAYNMPLPISGWLGSDRQDSWPENYGGSSYRGPESFRTALVKSDNTAAAWVMMNYVGVDRAADYLRRLGVTEEHIAATPFGVALGSSGLTPLEMATAFGVLGNGGVYQQPISFLGIVDKNGEVLYDAHASQDRRQVYKPSTAWLTVDILKQVITDGTGRAARISGQTVAGKTGTNSDQKGVFFSGLTGWYAGAVWIGHDNYQALSSKTTGGNSAAKLWQVFMESIHQDKNLQNRDILDGGPDSYGLIQVTTCAVSGQLATEACRHDAMGYGTVTDYVAREAAPQVSCQMHQNIILCTASNMIAGPYCPPETRATRGALALPQGHPLARFANTQYQGVLSQYLGPYAAAGSGLATAQTCTLHTHAGGYDQGIVTNTLLPDAQALLIQASAQLAALAPDGPQYQELLGAINNLNSVISQNPGLDTLAGAMGILTQAMAAAMH